MPSDQDDVKKPTPPSETTTDDEIIASLSKMKVTAKPDLPKPGAKFAKELAKTPFRIFEPIADLGFFTWTPKSHAYKSLQDVSVEEIRSQIDVKSQPNQLADIARIALPHSFRSLPPQEHTNKYPFSQYYIAGLHVATQHRCLPLDEIDFLFGGSTLSMLANKDTDGKNYLAAIVPGTNVTLVAKQDEYIHSELCRQGLSV
jgi:hypothetical protein